MGRRTLIVLTSALADSCGDTVNLRAPGYEVGP